MRDDPVNQIHDVLHEVSVAHCDVAGWYLEDGSDCFRQVHVFSEVWKRGLEGLDWHWERKSVSR